MSKTFHFDSAITIGQRLPNFTDEQVKNEPMLWRCSAEAARALGGPITQAFLDAIGDTPGMIIDTRGHMLMKGWWPCIPGWHHDDVPRTRDDGQPNYETPEYKARHVMALIGGKICPTNFALGPCDMPDVPRGKLIYREWHNRVEELIKSDDMMHFEAPSNQLIYFDWQTFHCGQQAIESGWRWFGRATFGSDLKPKNEVRNQVQVYLQFPMEGW